jgi:hypothetical protein
MPIRFYRKKATSPPEEKEQPLIPLFFETSPPKPQLQSPFFRLPRELRDQIYDLVFERTRSRYREGNLQLDILYGPYTGEWRFSRLHKGLLTCKLILSEALEQFYSKAQCLGYTGDQWYQKPSPYRLVSLYRIRKIILDMPSRYIALQLAEWSREPVVDGKMTIVSDFEHSSTVCPGIKPLYQHLRGKEHTIKDIKLKILMPETWRFQKVKSVSKWCVDLSAFDAFGSTFENIEFLIHPPNCERCDPQGVQHMAILYQVLQQKLEMVGKKMIGVGDDDEYGWSARDWVESNESLGWHIKIWKTPGEKSKRDVKADGLQCWKDRNIHQWFRRVPNNEEANNMVTFWTPTTEDVVSVEVWRNGERPGIEKTADSPAEVALAPSYLYPGTGNH